MRYGTIFPVVLVLLLLTACGRSRTPEAPATIDGRSRPAVALTGDGYAWDGQATVSAYRVSFDQAVNASVAALRKLGFWLDQKQSRRT